MEIQFYKFRTQARLRGIFDMVKPITLVCCFLVLAYSACSASSQTPLETKADAGDASAQYQLGVMFADGTGAPRDDAKAVEWFQKAATQGYANAQNKLGRMYADGRGVPKDDAKANEWFLKAALQGNDKAQFNLGASYMAGRGVSKDASKAVEWFQKAAVQGLALAQYNLGIAYSEGIGIPKDDTKAFEWISKAAVQGHDMAQWMLGVFYLDGKVIPRDGAKASQWFQKSAAQGLAEAQCSLGLMYAVGKGDLLRGYAWYNLAAASGNQIALKQMAEIEKKLTADQMAQAKKLSAELLHQIGQLAQARKAQEASQVPVQPQEMQVAAAQALAARLDVQNLIVKKVAVDRIFKFDVFRYFFAVKNTGTTPFIGTVEISLLKKGGETDEAKAFDLTIRPGTNGMIYVESAYPRDLNGIVGFSFIAKVGSTEVARGRGLISTRFEDLSKGQ